MANDEATQAAKSSIGHFWRGSRHPPAEPTVSYTGKVVLITGANVGLGLEAAIKYAALGASTLILGVRSLERGKAAKAQIEQKTACSPSVIQLLQLDMSDYISIEEFVKAVETRFSRINVAVLNAGMAPSTYQVSPHGWEMSLQVNVISTTYLAILLLPKLCETSLQTGHPTHLEIVSSIGHGDAKVESVKSNTSILDKVNDKNNFGLAQYVNTKLLVTWAMRQIANKTSPSQVIVYACCPGLCRTNLGRDFGMAMQIPNFLFQKIFARTSEEGSRTIVSGTMLGPEVHGGFWTNDQLWTLGVNVTSDQGKKLSDQFWKEILDILRKQNPKALSNWSS